MATSSLAPIDDEIVKQKSILLNLYTRRNSLSFTCRLPTEILTTIFITYACNYHETNESPEHQVPYWVRVSYVCRHWRNAALNCSALWTYIFAVSQRWTEELLARSKHASLKICVTLRDTKSNSWWSEFLKKVMNHVERIQKLRLYLLPVRDSNQRKDALFYKFYSLALRAPHLQTLAIFVNYEPPEWSSVHRLSRATDTPALHTLELSRCSVPWYSFRLGSLTTLSLEYIPTEFQQSMVEFQAILSRMQDLTYLYLTNALASDSDFLSEKVPNTSPKIVLPRLARLLVVAPLSAVVALLSCICIPLETEIRLQCDIEDDSSLDDFTLLSSFLAQRTSISEDHARPGLKIRTLVVQCSRWCFNLIFSTSERDCKFSTHELFVQWGRSVPLQIAVDGLDESMTRSDGRCIMSDICCSIPLMNVRSLHVDKPPFSPGFWRTILRHLQGVRYIKLSHGKMPDLASVLSLTPHDGAENQDGHADQSSNQMFAPELEELELSSIQFSAKPGSKRGSTTVDRQSLYDALCTRKESRVCLTLIRCDIGGHAIYHNQPNMVGRWEGGHLQVTQCDHSDSDTSGSGFD